VPVLAASDPAVTNKYFVARSRVRRLSAKCSCIETLIIVFGEMAMALEQQIKNDSVQSPPLLGLDIFARVDQERLQGWLGSVLLPVLVNLSFFESMGFESSFVRRFFHKHTKVLRFDGTIGRGLRGINDVEFLRGVAEALGVRSFADTWDPRDMGTTTAVAQQCLAALAA
jgi:hypothetical protein